MPGWKRIAWELEKSFDQRRRRDWTGAQLQIVPYRSYGTLLQFHVKGRVLRDRGISRGLERASVWRNLSDAWKRFASHEVPHAKVRAYFRGRTWDAEADDEGYFHIEIDLDRPDHPEALWHRVQLELIEPAGRQPVTAEAEVLVPSDSAEYGVISDIDDTTIRTDATSRWRMIRTVALRNAYARLPFEGVGELYRALHEGAGGSAENPIFFVSSSPWNLYDLLTDFFELQQIPPAPLLLQDFGISENVVLHGGHEKHKLTEITRIIETYVGLPFVLIGDSGQKDPEIYREAVLAHPGRVRAIYIRHVADEVRAGNVREIAAEMEAAGVPMLLSDDSAAAAAHAAAAGLIRLPAGW
jgi:phosphatidate phosphatase APP1